MTDDVFKTEVARLHSDVKALENALLEHQNVVKAIKEQLKEAQAKFNGFIQDETRPLFQIAHQEPQEDAGAHDDSPPKGKVRRRTNGPLSGTEAPL